MKSLPMNAMPAQERKRRGFLLTLGMKRVDHANKTGITNITISFSLLFLCGFWFARASVSFSYGFVFNFVSPLSLSLSVVTFLSLPTLGMIRVDHSNKTGITDKYYDFFFSSLSFSMIFGLLVPLSLSPVVLLFCF